ncbi:MAG TPA: hypothetical protein PLG59_06965 [bacterium]|nr:hypothetical protein [bacterium]HQP98129.1 hypothetical protein [bacterium]
MAIPQTTETQSPPIVETWRLPAVLWAIACLLIQIPVLEDRSFDPDEGLRVYCALELLQNRTPYRDFWDHKDPAEWLLCAGLMLLFGDSISGLRLGVNVLRALLVYHLCGLGQQARVGKNAWFTGGLATVLLIAEPIQGNTSAMEIPALLLVVLAMRLVLKGDVQLILRSLLLRSQPPPDLPRSSGEGPLTQDMVLSILAGVLSGFAMLLKPTAVVACLPALLVLFINGSARRLIGMAVGMGAAFGAIFGWCFMKGILSDWLFVMTVYNPSYSRGTPHWEYLSGVVPPRLFFLLPFLFLSGAGFLQQKKDERSNRLWLPIWLTGAVVSVCIGWRFYPHYFLLLGPPMALAGSHAIEANAVFPTRCPRTRSLWIWILLPLALFQSVQSVKWYWTEARDWKPPAIGFFTNEDILRLAVEIRHETSFEDSIFVIGYCPDLYVLSGRRSASRYFFHLPYTAEHSPIREEARREVLEILQNAPPKFIVVMKKDWTPQHPMDSDRFVDQWSEMSLFLEENYSRLESKELFNAYILKGSFNPSDDTDRPTPSSRSATEYACLPMAAENGDWSRR